MSRLAARGRRAAAGGRLPPTGPRASRLPQSVHRRGRPAARARASRTVWSRCAARPSGCPSRRWPDASSVSPRSGARASCCGRWCRTGCFPRRPTSAGRRRSRTTRRSRRRIAHFDIPRPVILPRPSATLVEPAAGARPRGRGAAPASPTSPAIPKRSVARWAREAHPEVEAAFARTREAIEREMGTIEEALGAHDPTLRAAAASARGRALHQVESLHEKAMRALKKRDQGRAERLRRTRDALLPGGSSAGARPRAGRLRWPATARRWSSCSGRGSICSRAATR